MMTASIPLAWLGTYLIHSTLLLGTVWALSRLLRRTRSGASFALEETLWKAALVGGILTASLQVGIGLAVPPDGASTQAAPLAFATATPAQAPLGDALPASARTASVTPHPLLATPAALLPGWQRLTLAVWLLGSLAGAVWLGGAWIRLRRMLRTRTEVVDGPSRHLLDRLVTLSRSHRPVRLTGSDRLPVPVALGVLEREICVPHRALASLGPRRQEGLLAHELAHLERRDPVWLLAARTIESLLFVQPLNRLARRHLQETAEYRCDAWAVEQTGDRAGLARCLTEVAAWLTGIDQTPAWGGRAWNQSPGMASGSNNLGRRVRRILAGEPTEAGPPHRGGRRWGLALPAVLVIGVGCFAPGVTPVLPDAPAAEAATDSGANDPVAPAADKASIGADDTRAEQAAEESTDDRDLAADAEADLGSDLDADWDADLDPALARSVEEIERMTAEIERRAQPDPAELARLHEELARVVERSMASQQEALEQLHAELDEELAAVGNVEELAPEERARLEAEIQQIAEKARRIAERSRPSREELDRLRLEALRLSQEALPRPEELERINREVERVNRDVGRMNQDIERMNRGELRQIEEHLAQEAARIEERAEREHRRQGLDERAAELEELHGPLDARRQELEERMHVLEERRQELEERFEAERTARERELQERRQELDGRRRELEERHQELLRQVEERERNAAGQEGPAEGEEPPR